MGCVLSLIAALAPRAVLAYLYLTSDYIGRAFDSFVWPVLGFFFMPCTALAYAWAINEGGAIEGPYLVVLVIAVLLDVGVLGIGSRKRRG